MRVLVEKQLCPFKAQPLETEEGQNAISCLGSRQWNLCSHLILCFYAGFTTSIHTRLIKRMQCKWAEQMDSWLEKALRVGLLLQILYHRCSFQLHLCSLPLVQTGSHSMVCGNMAVHHAPWESLSHSL